MQATRATTPGGSAHPVSAASAPEAAPEPAPLTRRQLRERERAEDRRRSEAAASAATAAGVTTSSSATTPVSVTTPAASAVSATSPVEAPAAPLAPPPAFDEVLYGPGTGRTAAAASPAGEDTLPEPAAEVPLAEAAGSAARAATPEPAGPAATRTSPTPAPTARPASARPAKTSARRWLPRLAVLGALAAVTTVVPLTGAALPSSSSDPVTGAPLSETSAFQLFSAGGSQVSVDTSAGLAADPLASLRSMVASSRSDDRTITCAAGAREANGVLASEVEMTPPDVVMPLTEGSFHYTSRYGLRTHPIFGSYGEHTGLDMAAAVGTPIHAVADGTVIHVGAGMDGRSSMLVIIEHEVDGNKFWTWYVHMYPNGVYVSEGQKVSAGEVIGAVGSYGNSTGPHLHFEVHLDNDLTTINPETWLAENAVPLNSETLQCTEG